ncbi:MAG: DUF3806 domain-containing protein [Rhodospirillales bacterium]|nr:DUF3806 domain-containing protein [Rhodospirillales bacterium]
MLILAENLAKDVINERLDHSLNDLERLQRILDSGSIQPEATVPLQALGLVFGKMFVENNEDYDWWIVEDEYGRDPCIRYKETTLMIFPQTVISKRIEEGEDCDISDMYHGLLESLEEIRFEHYEGE